VIAVIEAAIARNGVPEHLRSDNGPEFIASCMQDWLKAQEIKTLYIKPGSPWENGHIESFHDKLRDECLNRELFGNLHEARVILQICRGRPGCEPDDGKRHGFRLGTRKGAFSITLNERSVIRDSSTKTCRALQMSSWKP
jgi:transposase InsO family protein